MKTTILANVLLPLLASLILPPVDLLIFLTLSMVLDFLTGVVAAKMEGKEITSLGFRGTVKKFTQYGSAICVGILLANIADRGQAGQIASTVYLYFGNALISFIIFIEIKSILENLIKTSPNSDFTRYFLTPVNNLLSLDLSKFIPKTNNEKID